MLTDEMLLRASTEAQMGIPGALAAPFEQGEGAIGSTSSLRPSSRTILI